MKKVAGLLAAVMFAACHDAPTSPRQLDPKAPALSRAPSADAIPDQYIVVFNQSVADPAAAGRALAAQHDADVLYTYTSAIKGFAARMPAVAAAALASDPRVAYVEQDQIARAFTTQSSATWGIDRTDQRDLPLNGTYRYTGTGSGVRGYIIDTGIRTSHTEFGGRATVGYDAIGDGRNGQDCNGHGTHVAGTVGGSTYGIAKSVSLIAVRVLNCEGSGTNSGVIAGVDWVSSNHVKPAVANMSLGGGASTALDDAVKNSIVKGVTYAIAAGNDNADACNYSPARVGTAITVGATGSDDARASYSNWGTCLDLFGPGSSITSAWYTSDSDIKTISGTSMATPHVAGVAALYLQRNTTASPALVAEIITDDATTGKVTSAGSGSPNRLLHRYNDVLTGSGNYQYEPHDTYYYSGVSGYHQGWLRGTSGTDFDLYLYRWDGSKWVLVAQGISSSSDEYISYNASAGYYLWKVQSYSGSGTYDFWLRRP